MPLTRHPGPDATAEVDRHHCHRRVLVSAQPEGDTGCAVRAIEHAECPKRAFVIGVAREGHPSRARACRGVVGTRPRLHDLDRVFIAAPLSRFPMHAAATLQTTGLRAVP
jgi:hypothetical protein